MQTNLLKKRVFPTSDNGLYNDELFIAFFHRVMFPTYTALFVPLKPCNPDNWKDDSDENICLGDAACFAKLVWERGDNEVLLPSGEVDPALVRFYRQAVISSVIWNLADINFYREAASLFKEELNGDNPNYLIGNENKGWSYGTLFNTSALGVELYLNNYIRWNQKFYSAYLKYGFPYTNQGLGITAHDILNFKSINIDINLELWNQDFYGKGISTTTNLYIPITNKVDTVAQIGWKSEGYLLGRPVEKGLIGYFGIRYKLK